MITNVLIMEEKMEDKKLETEEVKETKEASQEVSKETPQEAPKEIRKASNNKEFSNVLKVKADGKETAPEERKRKVKNLAGAIAHGLRQFGVVYVRCFSPITCFKASKAIAIARGFVAVQGLDLFTICSFIEAEMDGQTKTGICYECFTNKTDSSKIDDEREKTGK